MIKGLQILNQKKITNAQNNTNSHSEKKETGRNLNNKPHFTKKSSNNFQANNIQNKYSGNAQSQQYRNSPIPMDIGNLEDNAENEVNFLLSPQNDCYP